MSLKRYTTKCKECNHDPNEHFFEGTDSNLYKTRKNDVKLAKEYCMEQSILHTNHKTKPIWKECCGILDYYQVALKNPKSRYPSYLK